MKLLPDLLSPLASDYQIFNLFRYITFRSGGAMMTSLFFALIFGSYFIKILKFYQTHGQPIRADGPQSHIIVKTGTPTMGGILILISFVVSTLLWVPLSNAYLWPVLLIAISFGVIGGFDDWLKIKNKSSDGMKGRQKLTLQIIFALIASIIFIQLSPDELRYGVAIPFLKNTLLYLGYLYIPFSIFVIVGSSNAVNLTDGLDG